MVHEPREVLIEVAFQLAHKKVVNQWCEDVMTERVTHHLTRVQYLGVDCPIGDGEIVLHLLLHLSASHERPLCPLCLTLSSPRIPRGRWWWPSGRVIHEGVELCRLDAIPEGVELPVGVGGEQLHAVINLVTLLVTSEVVGATVGVNVRWARFTNP